MNFLQWLEMSAPREMDKSKTYYHGTSSLAATENILKNGIDPSFTADKYGNRKSYLRPQEGKVYITPDLRMAIVYALGGDYLGSKYPHVHKESFGVVFIISGEKLEDISPDEDDVGAILHLLLSTPIETRKKYYHSYNWDLLTSWKVDSFKYIAKRVLTDLQYKTMVNQWGKGMEVAYQANIGKKIVKYLNDELKHFLIDAGAHVAHRGKLYPDSAWIIDKNRAEELLPDGSNFFSIAKKW